MLDVWLYCQGIKAMVFVLGGLLLVAGESLLRLIFTIGGLILPPGAMPWLDWLRTRIVKSIPRLIRGYHDEDQQEQLDHLFATTPELVFYHHPSRLKCETHYVLTRDGFRLVIHRLSKKINRKKKRNNKKEPVLLWHGFMQSSECFVAQPWSLGFYLALEKNKDVWMANARGNKYSGKHEKLSPEMNEYWNFSLDELALIDVPTVVDYILSKTKKQKQNQLTYVGFSQGTAVGLAALSMQPLLKKQIKSMICLAPTIATTGFKSRLLASIAKSSPACVYLMFGRCALLSLVPFWQGLLSVKAFCSLIDRSFSVLFDWKLANIHPADKPLLYYHLYSFTSVKSVVQWFQMLNSRKFQMHDDNRWCDSRSGFVVPQYPLQQISGTKLLFVCGQKDGLSDSQELRKQLSRRHPIRMVPDFEHMDFLFSRLSTRVFESIDF